MADKTQDMQRNNLLFLANHLTRKVRLNAPNGTNVAEGRTIAFEFPILPGWARKIRVQGSVTVNVALGAGAAVLSAAAPYNLFREARLQFGGQLLHRIPVYWYKVIKQIKHGGPNALTTPAITNGQMGGIFNTPTVANGDNVWNFAFDIDLQENLGSTLGLLPLAASASPLVLELDVVGSVDGTDPFESPVITTGGATASISAGSVTATGFYLYGQSPHGPEIEVPIPFSGQFIKRVRKATAITGTSEIAWELLREPYEHPYHMQAVVVPTAGIGRFCDFAGITQAELDLDPSTPFVAYNAATGGINDLWFEQRELYGEDLDVGVLAWNLIAGNMPELPNEPTSINVAKYNAAQAGIQYAGVLAANGNRIESCESFLVPIPV